jgi:SAGA-associated factor 29
VGLQEDALKAGEKVAARVPIAAEDSESDLWILAAVVRYLTDKKKYEIEDEDPGDEGDPNPVRKHYRLNKKNIVALPKIFNPNQVFGKGSQVLAMFPNTTTFYPAIIEKEASKVTNMMYALKFEDDEEQGRRVSRKVSFKYVIPMQKK